MSSHYRDILPVIVLVLSLFSMYQSSNYFALYGSKFDGILESETIPNDDFDLALRESLGFFDNIPSSRWKMLKRKVWDMTPNYNAKYLASKHQRNYRTFWGDHYEPNFVCESERRIGGYGDGAKWLCDPHRIRRNTETSTSNERCLVYSIGSNGDFSFEEGVHRDIDPKCEIHTFDFDDYSREAENAMANVVYHQVAFGTGEDVTTIDGRTVSTKSLPTIVKELGHENRVIDIFKIDCEGCEWSVFPQLFDSNVTLRQICIELHWGSQVMTDFVEQIKLSHRFFDTFYENNYAIYHKEANLNTDQYVMEAIEFSFVKLSPDFFEGIHRVKAEAYLRHELDKNPRALNPPPPQVEDAVPEVNSNTEETVLEEANVVVIEDGPVPVDWSNPFAPGEQEQFQCDFVEFQSSASGKTAEMCVHSFFDFVSDAIRTAKRWKDCDVLPDLWQHGRNGGSAKENEVYVEIGANIGACVMEMLLGTEARIIAFEPRPMNLFNLKMSLSKLGPEYQQRLTVYPIGLGESKGSTTIFAADNNMGNSLLGSIVKDSPDQTFDEKKQFPVEVYRADAVLHNIPSIRLLKMDAQGYECRVVEGMGTGALVAAIEIIHFEWAAHWLKGMGCNNLIPLVKQMNMDIWRLEESQEVHDAKPTLVTESEEESLKSFEGIVDLVATKPILNHTVETIHQLLLAEYSRKESA